MPPNASPWPVEVIDDADWLYRRLPPVYVKPDGTVSSKAFMRNSDPQGRKKEPDPDISVDWDRHTTPEQALERAGRLSHGIGALQAAVPRRLGLTVEHTPDHQHENRAHASILGNQGAGSKERCYLLAEEVSKYLLIRPTG